MKFKGLSLNEVEESRKKNGSNTLTQIPPDPLWKKILTAISDLGSIYNDHVGKIYLEGHQDPDGKKD